MVIKNRRLFIILSILSSLLLIPLIAMRFTDEVNWSKSDFVVAGILLFVFGFLLDLIIRKVKKRNAKIALCFILVIMSILIYIELAVGVFERYSVSGSGIFEKL